MYIFKQAKNAILNFDKYPELLKTKLSKVVFYALFFIIFLNAIYSSIVYITYNNKIKGFDRFIQEYIPDFTVENNKVIFKEYEKVSTPLDITFIFDPQENNVITNEDRKDVNNMILKVTPTYIISSSLNLNLQISQFLEVFNINEKADLINMKHTINIATIFAFVLVFFMFCLIDIVLLIISTLFINIIVNFYKVKLTLGDIFKLTVYVSTTPYLLRVVFSMMHIAMPSFIYIGVVLAYLHFIFKTISLDAEYNKASAN